MFPSTWTDLVVLFSLVAASLALSPISSSRLVSLVRERSGKGVPLASGAAAAADTSAGSDQEEAHLAEEGHDNVHAGYIVPVQIHHARIRPRESQHQFRYPSLFLALNLQEMEAGKAQLPHLFSWTPLTRQRDGNWFRDWSLTKLEPDGFGRRSFFGLEAEVQSRLSNSMLLKLLYELRLRGFTKAGPQDRQAAKSAQEGEGRTTAPWSKEVGQVWAVAMPSLLGMGGFNPLTIYYVYRPSRVDGLDHAERGPLWLVVLEVHNTFNERHVYICQVGVGEDKEKDVTRRRKYEHSWTFPRAFHVSPFNDRSGYYQLFISDLWAGKEEHGVPTLDVRLLLLAQDEETEEEEEGEDEAEGEEESPPKLHKKLLATLTSSQAKSSSMRPHRLAQPLTSANLLKALLSQPFDLILPVSRIMWQAAKLHWKRNLPVFIRPEQRGQGLADEQERHDHTFDGVGWPIDLNPTQAKAANGSSSSSGAIYWNQDGFLERACKDQFAAFACQQSARHTDTILSIVSRNAEVNDMHFFQGQEQSAEPRVGGSEMRRLTLYTLSSSLYLDFALYPPTQALLFGSKVDRNWGVSSLSDFDRFFQSEPKPFKPSRKARWASWARQSYLQWAIANSTPPNSKRRQDVARQLLHDTALHPYNVMDISLSFLTALQLQLLLIRVTAFLSGILHIRYVRRPWAQVDEGFQALCAEPQ